MARTFDVYEPLERAWTRKASLAVEVLDAVTLQRMSQGVTVMAKGLRGTPVVNHGGLFVWRGEDLAGFAGVVIDPGALPFAAADLAQADVTLPLHTIALQPLANYPFANGTTAIRGSLIETVPPLGVAPVPIANAAIRLQWLDDDGSTWHQPPQRFITDARGEFAAFIPFVPADLPQLDAGGNLSLTLIVNRAPPGTPANEKSIQFTHPQGRVSNAIHAWDQLA
jgi:hypothetical protein